MKTLKQKIEVMTAAANGAKIEYIVLNDPNDTWTPCKLAGEGAYPWNWALFDYRIMEPKQRLPLGPEDFPPGTLLRCSKEWPKHGWFLYHLTTTGLFVWWPDIARQHTWSNLTVLYLERSLDGGKTWLPCYREQ